MVTTDILLTDQAAFITGGAGGIGRGIALGMAKFGADIAIADNDPAAAESAVAEVRALGRRALFVQTDVGDPDQIRAAVAAADAEFGRFDILVNNAGGGRPTPFMEMSQRSRDKHMDFNLGSLFAATHAGAERMIAHGRGGAIINVSSIEAMRAVPGWAVYSACKAGMNSFTRTMALELADEGIRVNAIAPDIVPTQGIIDRYPDYVSPARAAARRRYIPLERDGSPDDCAAAAVFLASRMAAYITGVTLSVDGGTFASSGYTRDRDGAWRLYGA
jgi:NAD(P)-dependent dehydrogenase (short-subunit alcohol dehydrogenase family)